MKRVATLVVALVGLMASSSALASHTNRCGLVSYHAVYHGHSYSGKDAVFVVRGATSCANARKVDRRADEGLRTTGWRCAFSHHETVTTCTSASQRAKIQGRESTPPPVTSPPTTTPTTTPTPTPTACSPLTDSGTCYEPGEYCRASDHGTSGVAGDGEAILCEYNNGWRWEPI